ncbi:MAG: hypothetical protein AAFX06_11255 [Planctomycetota bacterium]
MQFRKWNNQSYQAKLGDHPTDVSPAAEDMIQGHSNACSLQMKVASKTDSKS